MISRAFYIEENVALNQKSIFPLSNQISQDRYDAIVNSNNPNWRMEDWVQAILVVMRNDPFYLDTSNERPRRTAIDQFEKAYLKLIARKFGKYSNEAYIGPYYDLDLTKKAQAITVWRESLNYDEQVIYGIQEVIRARDLKDNGLIPQQLVQNVSVATIYTGIALIAGAAIVEAASVGSAAAVGTATESGTLAGSTGLLGAETTSLGATTGLLTTEAIAAPTLGVATVAETGGFLASLSALSPIAETLATTVATSAIKNLIKPSAQASGQSVAPQSSLPQQQQVSVAVSDTQKILITALTALGAIFLL